MAQVEIICSKCNKRRGTIGIVTGEVWCFHCSQAYCHVCGKELGVKERQLLPRVQDGKAKACVDCVIADFRKQHDAAADLSLKLLIKYQMDYQHCDRCREINDMRRSGKKVECKFCQQCNKLNTELAVSRKELGMFRAEGAPSR